MVRIGPLYLLKCISIVCSSPFIIPLVENNLYEGVEKGEE